MILKYLSLVLPFCIVNVFCDVPRPRGVPLSKAPLYPPEKDFTCFDGSVTIPFSQVNDDYCDCFDGSDEPGTSACTNGVFYCTNAGHTPKNIPSSRVNDGICDCCDGTDEYASPNSCPNICEELGREARLEAERTAELYKAGGVMRMDLIEKGNVKKTEMKEKLSQLEKEKAEAEALVAEKEALKNEAESRENEALNIYREAEDEARARAAEKEATLTHNEAQEAFLRFDSNGDGILTMADIQTRIAFDKNRDGQVDEEEAKYFLADNEEVDFAVFLDKCWTLVKPFLMREQGLFSPPGEEQQEDQKELAEEVETAPEEGGEEDFEQDLDEHLDLDENQDLDDHESEHEEPAEEIHEEAKHYDEATQLLIDTATEARGQHSEALRTLRDIESNIKQIQESLERDYGPNNEFATLDGQCFEVEDKEYVYTVCMFGRVTQKSRSGGAEVGLGSWGEWAGEDNNKYSAMRYTGGVACWNGPNRSTLVHLKCGTEAKLVSVTEPFRCEYVAELVIPASCDETKLEHITHDEL